MSDLPLNKITDLAVGMYGTPIYIKLVDDNELPIDLSTYTSISVVVRTPDELKTVNLSATLYSMGMDGILYVTPSTGDLDRAGKWTGQIVMQTASSLLKSDVFTMLVERSLA